MIQNARNSLQRERDFSSNNKLTNVNAFFDEAWIENAAVFDQIVIATADREVGAKRYRYVRTTSKASFPWFPGILRHGGSRIFKSIFNLQKEFKKVISRETDAFAKSFSQAT